MSSTLQNVSFKFMPGAALTSNDLTFINAGAQNKEITVTIGNSIFKFMPGTMLTDNDLSFMNGASQSLNEPTVAGSGTPDLLTDYLNAIPKNEDYTKMSLTQLKNKRTLFQAQVATEIDPELAAEYNTLLNKVDKEIDTITYKDKFGGNTTGIDAIVQTNQSISDITFSIKENEKQRKIIAFQIEALQQSSPEGSSQLQIKDKQLELEYNNLETKLKMEQQNKKDYIECFTSKKIDPTKFSSAVKQTAIDNNDSINELSSSYTDIIQKRRALLTQAQESAQIYPELASQYQLKDKELELQEKEIKSQLLEAQSEKTSLIKQNAKGNKPTSDNSQFIMAVMQMLFKSLFKI